MDRHERIALFGIGSTNFRSVLADPSGEFLTHISIEPTDIERLSSQIVEHLESYDADGDRFDGVSIACAGLLDHGGGVIEEIDTPDGDVVRDIPIREPITDRFDVPVVIENDCTAAAIGEWVFGAGRRSDCESVVHVTFGTGIGAGVVERGHVLRGANGHAGEVGLFPIAPFALESCGVPGAWEAYCSGRGIEGYVSNLLESEDRETALPDAETVSAPDLFEAAEAGDPVASEYLDQITRYVGVGVATLINAYDPGVITVGGGVGGSNFDVLFERSSPTIEAFAFLEVPPIERTELGDEIGLYGALAPFVTPDGEETSDRSRIPIDMERQSRES